MLKRWLAGFLCFAMLCPMASNALAVEPGADEEQMTPVEDTYWQDGEDAGQGNQNNANPDGTTPDETTPDGTTPDGTTPDGTTPDGTTPDGTTPDETNPDETTPDGTTPDETNPDETTPDGTTPDETNPDETNPDQEEDKTNPENGLQQDPVTPKDEGVLEEEDMSRAALDLSTLQNCLSMDSVTITSVGGTYNADSQPKLFDGIYTDDNKYVYGFYNGAMNSASLNGKPAWLEIKLNAPRKIGGFEVAFPLKGATDSDNFGFEFTVEGKLGSGEYAQLATGAGGRIDTNYQHTIALNELTELDSLRFSITKGTGTVSPWPVFAELKAFAEPAALDLSTLQNCLSMDSVTITSVGGTYNADSQPKLFDGIYTDDNKYVYGFYNGAMNSASLNGKPAWLEIKLNAPRKIGGFEVAFPLKGATDSDNFGFEFTVEGKLGNGEYAQLATGTGGRIDTNYKHTIPLNELTELDSLRFSITKGTGTVSPWPVFAELKAFAESSGEEPPSGDKMTEIAKDCKIAVPSAQSGKPASNMVDGNQGTLWVHDGAAASCDVTFELPKNSPIKKVEIDFERGEHAPNRSVDVTIKRVVNGVITDPETLTGPTKAQFTDTFVYEMADPQYMTHLVIGLSNLNPASLYPAIAEVRIYMVDDNKPLEEYDNIASKATITSVGNTSHGTSANLVDNDNDTLYGYFNGVFSKLPEGEPAWIELDYGGNQQVRGLELAFEKPGTGTENTTFTYNIKGKLKRAAGATGETEWTTYVKDATATRAEGKFIQQYKLDGMVGMSQIRIEVTDCTSDTAYPALAELRVFGEYVEPVTDKESIAWEKPVHGNFNAANAYLVTDGNTESTWVADMYPSYADIDLGKNYDLSEIQVFTGKSGYAHYSVYTSLNNRDFSLVGEKQNTAPCEETGDKYTLENKAARYVRVYLEYNSASPKGEIREVRVLGTESSEPAEETPAIKVTNFDQTEYAKAVTQDDTIAEVQAIITRNVGAAYVNWFTFEIAAQSNGYDYFKLTDDNGKIKVTGNDGVSLATGVNHYLKYFCNVHISQVGSQTVMPAAVVPVGTAVHKETRFPVRYAYNYCTHSYSMPFWGAKEWQIERDWLALNGVNLVLDITGQEEVWRRFLNKVGYSNQDAKDYIAGPAYYAWAYMSNLSGFGGPVHDSWFEDRTEVARENQYAMRKLGMDVCLQAFSGMVPVDLAAHDANAAKDIIPQPTWCSFQRPSMLKTDTQTYKDYAAKFYQAQEEVFGKTARYYATDPFHEGGDPGGVSPKIVAEKLLDELITYDSDAVWVIQSWQGNPTDALLEGLYVEGKDRRKDHALVLDLYAEKDPNWNYHGSYPWYGNDTDGDELTEFADTPWVFCQLNNFGGRMGLHGHLDNLAKKIPAAANTAKHMAGIGISPEASQNNPLIYDFLFETVWTDNASTPLAEIDVTQWLADYARRRYGAESTNAVEAMEILSETVYKASLNMKGQGAPESVINARPAKSIEAASTWGNAVVGYNKTELEKAARLLLEDYDTLSASDAYLYDLADILKQVLSNTAQEVQKEMAAAIGNEAEFATQSQKFLDLIDLTDQVLGTREEFLFGTWTTRASALAKDTDDFTKRLYLANAKGLVTTWGAINQCNSGGLKDYSNRQWSGLTSDYYKARWEKWIDATKAGTTISANDWFQWEWEFARNQTPYTDVANGLSLKTLGEKVLTDYASPVEPPEPGPEYDIDRTTTTVTAGTEQSGEGSALAIDGDSATLWHSSWAGAPNVTDRWITVDLGAKKTVDGLRYQPRQSGRNGIVTGFQIDVSDDNSTWETVAEGTWKDNLRWKLVSFDPVEARYVRLTGVHTIGDAADKHMSAAEIRVTAPASEKTDLSSSTITLPKTSYSYTGSEIKPVPTVKLGEKTLIADTNYTVAYTDNTEIGTATVTITGKGNYIGTNTTTFEITAAEKTDLSSSTIELPQESYVYTGSEIKPVPTVTLNGKTLTATTDYTVAYTNNTAVGTATVTITGAGNYTGTKSTTFKITSTASTSIADSTITLPKTSYVYTGEEIKPVPTVKLNGTTLTADTDYTVAYTDNTAVGTATVTITGADKYTGTKTKTFEITSTASTSIADSTITLPQTSYVYTGEEIKPVPTVTLNETTLTADTDYTVAYTDNTAVGTATVTITGKGNYTGEKSTTFAITAAAEKTDLSTSTIELPAASYVYTGEEIKPEPTVKLGETTLIADTDYTVAYTNNKEVGTATVTITGKGNYIGTKTKTFAITRPPLISIADSTITLLQASYVYTGSEIKPVPTVKLGETTLIADTDYTVAYTNNKEIGTATVTITAKGKYTGTNTKTFAITSPPLISIADSTITLPEAGYIYTGSEIKPVPTVTLNGKTLTATTDYTVAYTNNKEVGVATVTITGTGDYTGTKTKIFTINDRPSSGGGSGGSSGGSGGGSGGSSGGSGNNNTPSTKPETPTTKPETPTTKPETTPTQPETPPVTVTKPDGSTVTTVTDSKTGTVTESTVKDGKVEVSTTITENALENATNNTVQLPESNVTATQDKNNAPEIKVTLPKTEAAVKVAIPVSGLTSGTVAVLVKPDGTQEVIRQSVTADGKLIVPMSDSGTVKIIDNSKPFVDVNQHWANDSISFVSSRELFNGTSETTFTPEAPMTRAMLATVLYRIQGEPKTESALTFGDVAEGEYYTNAISWAAASGIVTGSNGKFLPDQNITREQLAVMLYRSAGSPSIQGNISAFADADMASDWSSDALVWATANGIITGDNGNIAPQRNATRGEVATMIERFAKATV